MTNVQAKAALAVRKWVFIHAVSRGHVENMLFCGKWSAKVIPKSFLRANWYTKFIPRTSFQSKRYNAQPDDEIEEHSASKN